MFLFSIFFEQYNSRLFLECLFIYLSPPLFFLFWQPHWQDVLFEIQKSISCHHRRCDKMSVSAGVHVVEGIGVKKMWPSCLTTLVVSFFFSQYCVHTKSNWIPQIFSYGLNCTFEGCMETKPLCFHVSMFSLRLIHPCYATTEVDDGLTWSPTAHHHTIWQLDSGLWFLLDLLLVDVLLLNARQTSRLSTFCPAWIPSEWALINPWDLKAKGKKQSSLATPSHAKVFSLFHFNTHLPRFSLKTMNEQNIRGII